MMKRSFSYLIYAIVVVFFSQVFSQDSSSSKSGVKCGIGITTTIFSLGTVQYYIPESRNTALTIPIYIRPKIKLEPFISYVDYRWKSENDPPGTTSNDLRIRSVIAGLGIFYSKSIKETKLHFGAKFGYIKSEYESYYDLDDHSTDREEEGSGYLISPGVGGEYFFSDHFSLGGEANVEWSTFDSDDLESYDTTETKSSSSMKRLNTLGSIYIRFYFN